MVETDNQSQLIYDDPTGFSKQETNQGVLPLPASE